MDRGCFWASGSPSLGGPFVARLLYVCGNHFALLDLFFISFASEELSGGCGLARIGFASSHFHPSWVNQEGQRGRMGGCLLAF